jgi:hypothetical protein
MKTLIPIQSGNTKYLGMTLPEWCVALIPGGVYMILLEGKQIIPAVIIHGICIAFYALILSKMEENIFGVINTNRKISNIILGYPFSPTPIEKPVAEKGLFDADN